MQPSIGTFDPSLLSYLGTPQIDTIKHVVATAFHLSVHNLESLQQGQHIVAARHIAMYLMRALTDLSFPKIGIAFHRHHSTVIYGSEAIARRIEREPAFAAMVQRLRERCESGDAA